jgi:hypothetical protein
MRFNQKSKRNFSFQAGFIPLIIIGISIMFSLSIKIIYGIVLGINPLSITVGLYLGVIAVFSVIFGKLVFYESITRHQMLGIVFIVSGIIILMV